MTTTGKRGWHGRAALPAALALGALFASGVSADRGAAAADGAAAPAPAPVALVIDAPLARDGRELVDERLEHLDAAVRLPRTGQEARTDVRYLDALGYRVVVAGPSATAAADGTGVHATHVAGLGAAVAEAR
jgi:hypothetical protein